MELSELGAQVNALRSRLGKEPLKNPTKQGATKLQAQLDALQAEWDQKNPPPPPPPPEPDPAVEEQKPYSVLESLSAEQRQHLMQPGRVETIRSMSERLLTFVGHIDESDKRSVGLLYNSMLALIREKFPKAQTSVACLRWYAVHMRQEDKRLPQKRPRPPVRQ